MTTEKLMLRASLTWFLSIIVLASFAQKNFMPGYILLTTGDTVTGFIDYRNWERNPGKVFFKQSQDGTKTGYSPIDIKGFGVLDEIYISAIIQTETTSDKTNDLTFDPEVYFEVDTGFLQTLVHGTKSLYLFRTKLGKEQYYIGNGSGFDLLVYKKYLRNQNGESSIAENRKYIGQLTLYLSDCPTIQQKLSTAKYQQNSLEDIFLSYYGCIKSGIDFHKKTEKINLEFGILAGASCTMVKFSSAFYDHLVKVSFSPSFNFSGGVFLDVVLPRNARKWSIYNELLFTSLKINGEYEEYTSENKYTIYHTTLGCSYLKLVNLLRYKFSVGNAYIFANAGLSNGFIIAEKNQLLVKSVLFQQERIEEKKALDETRTYEVGFLGGLGVRYKRFTGEVRYEYGTGMSPYMHLKSPTNRIYLLLGFRIL